MDARARNNDTTDGNRGGPTPVPVPVPLSPPWEAEEAEALSTAFLAKFSSSRTCFAPAALGCQVRDGPVGQRVGTHLRALAEAGVFVRGLPAGEDGEALQGRGGEGAEHRAARRERGSDHGQRAGVGGVAHRGVRLLTGKCG